MTPKILVIDDEQNLRDYICKVFKSENYRVKSVASARDAKTLVNEEVFNVVHRGLLGHVARWLWGRQFANQQQSSGVSTGKNGRSSRRRSSSEYQRE